MGFGGNVKLWYPGPARCGLSVQLLVPSTALVLINSPNFSGEEKRFNRPVLYGAPLPGAGSRELQRHGPPSLMSSAWELSLTISLLQHLNPAAELGFQVVLNGSIAASLQAAVGIPPTRLPVSIKRVYVSCGALRLRTSTWLLDFHKYEVPSLFFFGAKLFNSRRRAQEIPSSARQQLFLTLAPWLRRRLRLARTVKPSPALTLSRPI